MKKSFKLALLTFILLASGISIEGVKANSVNAKTYSKAVTKIAGSKNYSIYHRVSSKGPAGKFTSTKYFKYGQIQSKKYISTKKGTYWDIYVDGRHVGWVNQNFFARDKISVAGDVSLVNNAEYSFNTKDAINYVTDSKGTAIDLNKVSVDHAYINSGKAGVTKVNYSYKKAHALVNVTVRNNPAEAENLATLSPQKGFKLATGWKGSSKGSSTNWNAVHHYTSETRPNTIKGSNGLILKTRLYQPRFVSLSYGQAADAMGQVGVIPEGITVNDNIFAASMYSSSNDDHGHIVSYNLNHIKSKTAAQNLTTMKWSTFKSYAKHIKVSPYIKLGHGQALGSSQDYIYVMANNNKYSNGPQSEEILQIRKSDMQINKIWTFRIATNRYIHNATFVGDNTMYALFHNGAHGYYEYWKLTRSGDEWHAQEVGATQGNFVSNSPVQGFAYGNGNFYIGFNDHIFKVSENGQAKAHYKFNTRRELEGMSVNGSQLYVEFAQRSELTVGKAD
ncbi:hypothetical protein J2Z60_000846 [Lactobacillus colini]|uniref:GW domain-containing protein n=1 Tax=Lactobacillus colini TaxID=1819254 RepID=A0ABS4MDB3_9LACO|nr:SH3-like domain-containing protein [Lactobacillus colini]MBP2057675.1 hypothetical protein [Lactobacillus colini]